jgi:hypothetical protein
MLFFWLKKISYSNKVESAFNGSMNSGYKEVKAAMPHALNFLRRYNALKYL